MTTPNNNAPPVSVTRLTFQDNFNSFSASASGLGTTWQDLYPYGGEAAHTLSGNSEAEYYSSALSGSNSPFSDSNGVLNIDAFPAAAGSNPYNLPYTSGVITTAQSFSQTYGYFEVDAKLPSGQGLWPAFWALPTAGYTAELDDFEIVNNTNTIYSTVHGTTNGSWSSDSQAFPSPDLSQAFHVFGFNWTPTTVTYYLDGVEYGSAPTPQSMDSPMFLLLNLAVGGNGSWPGSPNSSTVFPADMQIAWVQAYATPDTTYVGGSASIPAGSSAATVSAPVAAVTAAATTPVVAASTVGAAATTTTTTTATPATAAVTTPADPASVAIGSGPDTLTLQIAEDHYLGDAQFTISIDGVQQGGVQTTTALQDQGEIQDFTIAGSFGTGAHTVSLDFLNDAYAGTSSTDRNLYLDGALINGVAVPSSTLNEYSAGSQSFSFTGNDSAAAVATAAAPASSDTLVVGLTEDAYLGDAIASIAIDGKTIATPTVTFLNSAGTPELFTYTGDFGGAGVAHDVAISFTNDLYAGTPSTDRNLYVKSVSFDGTSYPDQATMYSAGTTNFTIPATTTSQVLAKTS